MEERGYRRKKTACDGTSFGVFPHIYVSNQLLIRLNTICLTIDKN